MTSGKQDMAILGVIVLALLSMAAYQRLSLCSDPEVLHIVIDQFRRDRQLSGVMITDIIPMSRDLFNPRSCRALLTEIRANVDVTAHPWVEIEYSSPIKSPPYKVVGLKLPARPVRVK